MKIRFSLGILASLALAATASSQTVDFPQTKDSHWTVTNLAINTTAGTLDPVGLTRPRNGFAYNNQEPAPGPVTSFNERYRLTGAYNLRDGSSLAQGFFDPTVPAPGPEASIVNYGFGVEVINGGSSPVEGDRVLLVGGDLPGLPGGGSLSISLLPGTFSFQKDSARTASVFYDLTIRRIAINRSPDTWNISGIVDGVATPGGPSSRFLVNQNFNVDFGGGNFGIEVREFPILVGPGNPPANAVGGISSLQWSVTTVPEPSGVLLLSLGAFGMFLRRKR